MNRIDPAIDQPAARRVGRWRAWSLAIVLGALVCAEIFTISRSMESGPAPLGTVLGAARAMSLPAAKAVAAALVVPEERWEADASAAGTRPDAAH